MLTKPAPKPNSFMDSVALRHDREVPGQNFIGCHTRDSVCRAQLFKANLNFIKDAAGYTFTLGLYSFSQHRFVTPRNAGMLLATIGDPFVAVAGTALFAFDNLQMMVQHGTGLGHGNHTGEFWGGQMKYMTDTKSLTWGAVNALWKTDGNGEDKATAVRQYFQDEINNRICLVGQNYIRFLVFGH